MSLAKDAELIGCVLQRYLEQKGILTDLSHVIGRAQEWLKANDIAPGWAVIGDNQKLSEGEGRWLKLSKTWN